MAALAAGACSAVVASLRTLPGVSAASGLEIMPDARTAYIAGDNSVFLYQIDLDDPSRVQRRLRLCAARGAPGGEPGANGEEGIAKKVKPDFESITALPYQGATHIAVFGSGSKVGRAAARIVRELVRSKGRRALPAALALVRGPWVQQGQRFRTLGTSMPH